MHPNRSISDILKNSGTLAIIGASSKEYRTSHHMMHFLLEKGYRVIPVNPNENSVLGQKCYHSVLNIPSDILLDIMVIFRNKTYTEVMVREIVKWSRKNRSKPVIWTQLDVSSPEAEAAALEEGLPYVKNRCIMVDYRSLA